MLSGNSNPGKKVVGLGVVPSKGFCFLERACPGQKAMVLGVSVPSRGFCSLLKHVLEKAVVFGVSIPSRDFVFWKKHTLKNRGVRDRRSQQGLLLSENTIQRFPGSAFLARASVVFWK